MVFSAVGLKAHQPSTLTFHTHRNKSPAHAPERYRKLAPPPVVEMRTLANICKPSKQHQTKTHCLMPKVPGLGPEIRPLSPQ